MKTFLVSLLLAAVSLAQNTSKHSGTEPYAIPFASKGNTVELVVANAAQTTTSQIAVEATEHPAWIRFARDKVVIGILKSGGEMPAAFSFDVDKQAPVNGDASMLFTVRASNGDVWTKKISVRILPPEKFELYQNFPNPFNPRTVIGYQLPAESNVSLKVYNVIGQEVAMLVGEVRQAGYHQEVFDGSRFASGVYVCRIVCVDRSGLQSSARKTMVLLK